MPISGDNIQTNTIINDIDYISGNITLSLPLTDLGNFSVDCDTSIWWYLESVDSYNTLELYPTPSFIIENSNPIDYIIDTEYQSIPSYNFTDYEPPTNFIHYMDNNVTDYSMFFMNPYYLQIIIYAIDSEDIAEYQLDRILTYVSKIVPPEIKYQIIYANDIKTKILYPTEVEIDFS
jgi:hypothetical protein